MLDLSLEQLRSIELVGGCSRIPAVRTAIATGLDVDVCESEIPTLTHVRSQYWVVTLTVKLVLPRDLFSV